MKTNTLKEENTDAFPFFSFEGTYYEIGKQYGESCRDLINQHMEYAFNRLRQSISIDSIEEVERAALEYRPFVKKHAAFFDEELQGLAEGAEISLGAAYFLQLRAEIYDFFDTTDECTTFAVSKEATKEGIPMIGQNADLPAFYKEVGVVIESIPKQHPATLMLTPAGQISYIGINNEGVGVCANFLECEGWRVGFPRYLLSRLALTKDDIVKAENVIQQTYRASSRNILLSDRNSSLINLEAIPNEIGRVKPTNGVIGHSNHFISDSLLHKEGKTGEDLLNSQTRLERINELLKKHHGSIDVETMIEVFRDRETYPHTLCRVPGDFTASSDAITFASVIAEPTKGNLWVAIGPPNEYEFKKYTFTK